MDKLKLSVGPGGYPTAVTCARALLIRERAARKKFAATQTTQHALPPERKRAKGANSDAT